MFTRLTQLPHVETAALASLARGEGFRFLDRLIAEWHEGVRFDGPGERLIGAFNRDRLVAIGGLNRDPYAGSPHIARLRRLYVAPDRRRDGLGRRLVASQLDGDNGQFKVVRLKAPDVAAAAFYDAIGVTRIDNEDATHVVRRDA